MRTANYSNDHPLGVMKGWVAGTSATGTGGGSVTVELFDGSGAVIGIAILRVAALVDHGSGDVTILPAVQGSADGTLTQLALNDAALFLNTGGTPGDLSPEGIKIQAGDDYLGFWISEKDSGTLQLWPIDSSGNDIELRDWTTSQWRAASDNYTTPLAGIPHLYRLPFAWNTASIASGVAVGTVKAGDMILGAWLDIATAWNSTVSDAGDILTTTTSESLMSGTTNMQSVGAGTDRRFLKDGALLYGQQSIMRTNQTILVKVTSTGISLSAGAATAFVLVVPSY